MFNKVEVFFYVNKYLLKLQIILYVLEKKEDNYSVCTIYIKKKFFAIVLF